MTFGNQEGRPVHEPSLQMAEINTRNVTQLKHLFVLALPTIHKSHHEELVASVSPSRRHGAPPQFLHHVFWWRANFPK